MRQYLHFKLCLSFFLCAQIGQVQAQQNAAVYSWFDQVVGLPSTGIFNAVEYVEKHRTINEYHKFFLSQGFLPGSVIYDGQPYFDLEIKYNVFDDLLQVKVPNRGNESLFQLLSEKVERFRIADHEFINIGEHGGFHEILLENNTLTLLVKHRKSFKRIQDKQFVYYEFEKEDSEYLLKYQGVFHEIESRRDVMTLFPQEKKSIRKFYTSNRSLRKSDPKAFLQQLFQFLSQAQAT